MFPWHHTSCNAVFNQLQYTKEHLHLEVSHQPAIDSKNEMIKLQLVTFGQLLQNDLTPTLLKWKRPERISWTLQLYTVCTSAVIDLFELRSSYLTIVVYWPLTHPSIRDLWDRMFQQCNQEDCSGGLTSGSKSHKSQPECIGVMKLYIDR